MRWAILSVVFVSLPVIASAQGQPCTTLRYTFDPYKPSDLALIRQLGAGVVAQAPLTALLRLDPYVPTEAALLRQYGGALPVWPYAWDPIDPLPFYSLDTSRDCASQAPTTSADSPITTFAELSSVLQRTRASLAVAPGDRSVSSTATPLERNRGVSIDYAGRTWVSAGRAVPFDDAQFVRVGAHAGFPVFRRIGANEETIYLPIGTGAVAPFHAMQR